ncbi:alpha-1,2-mannosyltransferase ktr1, partial [Elasticomyces elasticus]
RRKIISKAEKSKPPTVEVRSRLGRDQHSGWSEDDMAGSTRYLRYIVFAFICLIVVFLFSSTSSVPSQASNIIKDQTSRWRGSQVDDVSGAHTGKNDNKPTSPNPHTGLPPAVASGPRMNATFVTLARNNDVWEIARSIRQVEDRFNRKYNYDWVFLNDQPFDDTFKKVTSALTSGNTKYGVIPEEHWSFPDFINQTRAKNVREDMAARKIIYGDSVSYRHMCRYESGFFFRHPLMLDYEWYWRVEPSIELFCDINYDTFKYMADNNKKYSFVLSLYEYVETIPTLWDSVKGFMKEHPEH